MNKWEPIPLSELQEKINKGVNLMSQEQISIWNQIAIRPEKWIETEQGEMGGGFWVVAIYTKAVVWYNDIEEGFNISSFSTHGKIEQYEAEQDELQWTIHKLKTHPNTLYI